MKKGCSLLHLDFIYEEEDKIIVEQDDQPNAKIYSFEECRKHFVQNPDDIDSIKVVIIGSRNVRPLSLFSALTATNKLAYISVCL